VRCLFILLVLVPLLGCPSASIPPKTSGGTLNKLPEEFSIITSLDKLKTQNVSLNCPDVIKQNGVVEALVRFIPSGTVYSNGEIDGNIVLVKTGAREAPILQPYVDKFTLDTNDPKNKKFKNYFKDSKEFRPSLHRIVAPKGINVRDEPSKKGIKLSSYSNGDFVTVYTKPILNLGMKWVLVGRKGRASGFAAMESRGEKYIEKSFNSESFVIDCKNLQNNQVGKQSKLFPKAIIKTNGQKKYDNYDLFKITITKDEISNMAELVKKINYGFKIEKRRDKPLRGQKLTSQGSVKKNSLLDQVKEQGPVQNVSSYSEHTMPVDAPIFLKPSVSSPSKHYFEANANFYCKNPDKYGWCKLKSHTGYVNLGIDIQISNDNPFYDKPDLNTQSYILPLESSSIVKILPHNHNPSWGVFVNPINKKLQYVPLSGSRKLSEAFNNFGRQHSVAQNFKPKKPSVPEKAPYAPPAAKDLSKEPSQSQKQLRSVLARLPTAKKFTLGLKLPREILDTQLAGEITVENCDRRSGTVNTTGSYLLFTCHRATDYWTKVGGFNSIELADWKLSDKVQQSIGIEVVGEVLTSRLKADFFASMSESNLPYYRYGSKKLIGTADVNSKGYATLRFPNLSVKEIGKPIRFSVPGARNCDFQFKFLLENTTPDRPLKVETVCDVVTVKSPFKIKSEHLNGCTKISGDSLQQLCIKRKRTPIKIDFGPGWAVPNKDFLELERKVINLSKSDFRPAWPFKRSDPWLDQKRSSDNNCNEVPHYQAKEVLICGSDNNCKKGIVDSRGGKTRLPNLSSVKWTDKSSLPKSVKVNFYRQTTSELYPKTKTISWRLNESPPTDLKVAMNLPLSKPEMLPVQVDFDVIRADPSARFMIFDSEKECKQATKPSGQNWRPYHPSELSGLQAQKCSFAKLRKGEEDLSECLSPNRLGKKFLFRPLVTGFPGKRIVLLVANSKKFSNLAGKGVQDSLINWLTSIKKSTRKLPITVLTVEGDGRIRTLIRGEELEGMAVSAQSGGANIRARVKQRLNFNGTGLQPLENLQDFEHKLQSNIDRVVYITDGSLRDEADIRGADLGTPLNWKISGVDFRVVTTGRCSFWTEKAQARMCNKLTKKNAKTVVSSVLSELIQ